jgi:hypothetical protein
MARDVVVQLVYGGFVQFLSPALRIVRTTLRSPTLSANSRMSTAARRFNGHL